MWQLGACQMKIHIVFGLVLLLAPNTALGHGFMFEPKARNVVHDSDSCPHCLAMGGPYSVSARNTLSWPDGKRGICGDIAGFGRHEIGSRLGVAGGVYGPVGPQAEYFEGQVINISLLITIQHGGRHVFRLCDRIDPDEACFASTILERADGKGPFTWSPVTPGPLRPKSNYTTGTKLGQSGEVYTMKYKLPENFTCNNCTLQWWWTTANSCDLEGNLFGSRNLGDCTSPQPGPYPEEFVNCADVTIQAREVISNASAAPAPALVPAASPVGAPQVAPAVDPAPAPAAETAAAPVPAPAASLLHDVLFSRKLLLSSES